MDRQIVFLCVGTTKIAGDSLAPMVADNLVASHLPIYVYGTTEHNVNRKNLINYVNFIKKIHKDCILVTIDAGLSTKNPIGTISIQKGGISPAGAVSDKTFKIGDVGILGIVNKYQPDVIKALNDVDYLFVEFFSKKIANMIINCLKKRYFNLSY